MPTLVENNDSGETSQNESNYAARESSQIDIRAPSEGEANLLLNLAQTAAKFTTESNSSHDVSENDVKARLRCGILTPGNHDILSGRGQRAHNHSGNVIYRRFINEERRAYVNGNPREKKFIITKLLQRIKNMSPPGRFLRGDPKTGFLEILPDDEARKKTAQALRENAVNIRKTYVPGPSDLKASNTQESKAYPSSSFQGNTQSLPKMACEQETFLYKNDRKRKALDEVSSSEIKYEKKRIGKFNHSQVGVHPFPLPRNKMLYHRANIHPLSYKGSNAQMTMQRDGRRMFAPPKNYVPLQYTTAEHHHQKNQMIPSHPHMNQSPHNDDGRNKLTPRNVTTRFPVRMQSDPPGSHCDEIRKDT